MPDRCTHSEHALVWNGINAWVPDQRFIMDAVAEHPHVERLVEAAEVVMSWWRMDDTRVNPAYYMAALDAALAALKAAQDGRKA